MNDQTDAQLLRAYAEHRSEPAFAELVRRHVDLVHSAARRMTGDGHLAQDVTQGVFVAFAQHAAQLQDHPVLSGWLHRTAQNIAAQTVRMNVRRRVREQEAAAMNEAFSPVKDATWDDIAPQLDTALGDLSEPDRDALLLRYFERKSANEMAAVLGISAEAAQKRVSRAVERLREFFAKQGVTVGASGLVVVLSANAVQTAPAGLVTTIATTAALTGSAIVTTKIIAMTALQKTGIAIALAAAVGVGIFKAHEAAQLRNELCALQNRQTALETQAEQAGRERDAANNLLAGIREDNQRLRTNAKDVLRLRGEVTMLRNDARTASLARERQQAASAVPTNAAPLPVITYTATVRATVNWDHAMVTGGWKMPSGKRAIMFAVPKHDGDTGQILLEIRLLELSDEAAVKFGLDQFNTDGQETTKGEIITPEVYERLMAAAEKMPGVDMLSCPRVSTLSGRQAQVSVTDSHQTSFGEAYTTGPTLDLLPTISADGKAVDIGLVGKINLERETGN